jgi:hypothetical protein
MPTNTIHRAQILDQLQSAAIEKQQSIEQAQQDSIAESQQARQGILTIRQNARASQTLLYNQNVQRQLNENRDLNNGFDSLATSKRRLIILRNKERLQSKKVTDYKLLKKNYLEIKSQEVKQQQEESQNRQNEITSKAREMLKNILPFRQKKLLEIDELKL